MDSAVFHAGDVTLQQSAIVAKGLAVGRSAEVGGDMLVHGRLFSESLGVKRRPVSGADIDCVSYGFNINETNQLEIIRHVLFSDSNSTTVLQRVAVFGAGNPTLGTNGDANGDMFQALSVFNASQSPASNTTMGTADGSGGTVVQFQSDWATNSHGDLYYATSKVGMGLTVPEHELHVAGTVAASNAIFTELTATYVNTSNATSQGFYLSSDERIKDFTGSLTADECLECITKLPVLRYSSLSDDDRTPRIGLRAQDVQALVPDAVHMAPGHGLPDCRYLDTNTLIAVAYGGISMLAEVQSTLQGAISCLSEEVTAAKQTTQRLSGAMDAMNQRMDVLYASLQRFGCRC
jgi:hypothetical protein